MSLNFSKSFFATVREEPARAVVPAIAVLAVLRYWILPLRNSFWLDESLIVTIARKPLREVGMLAYQSNQPILFGYIEYFIGQIFGTGEIAMRIPSLLAAFGSVYVLYWMGKEFRDRETGLIYALLFIFLIQTAPEASNARPYTLGLFSLLLSIRSLLRWMRDQTTKQAMRFALYTALSAYLHPFFLIALPFEIVYAARILRRGDRKLMRQAAWAMLVCFVLMLPLVVPIEVIINRREIIKFPAPPYVLTLIQDLFPASLIVGCMLGWGIARSRKSFRLVNREQVILGALLMTPIPLLFGVSKIGGISVFVDRYLLCAVPGLILFWGSLIRSIEPAPIRRFALSGGLLLAFLTLQPLTRAVPDFHEELWRSALESAPRSGQTLIYAGLAETRKIDWLQDPSHWDYLVSPVAVYRPEVSPDRDLLIPFEFDGTAQNYMDGLLKQAVKANTVTVIARNIFSAGEWLKWIGPRLEGTGYSHTRSESYGMVELRVFERPAR